MKIVLCENCTCSRCSNENCEYYCKEQVKNCDMGIDTGCDCFKPKKK